MPKSIAGLKGIVPPVVTPLNADYSVDYPSFTKVIEHLLAGGVHGLFFLGSTSVVVFIDPATAETAKQLRTLGHEMLVKLSSVDPDGLGLAMIPQRWPFQCSTKVR